MMSAKQLKLLEKSAARERQVIVDLNAVVKDIERCEKTIVELNRELGEVNTKHQGPRNTQQDVAYLSALLDCAKKKLVWEKQIASLQKRVPAILKDMGELLENRETAPVDEVRAEMVQALEKIQASMTRLQAAHG